jgi:DNA processing protein
MSVDPAWVALSLVDHLGGKKLRALVAYFNGDLGAILSASEAELRCVPGIGPKIAASIRATDVSRIEQALPRWQASGVRIITVQDTDYPAQLRAIDDAPPTLFTRGEWRPPIRAAAVVGTRQPSAQSVDAAQRLGYELAHRGCAVVSGLALGVDAAAHLGALSSPDGYTIAVLGGGVLNVYPPENRALAQAITRRGALVCEVHPAAEARTPALVARNRLISGLCDAVFVIETSVDGGAMHAARRAFEQGRVVYALDNGASGNRALIEMGAIAFGRDLKGIDVL